jgi:hypothetical protein
LATRTAATADADGEGEGVTAAVPVPLIVEVGDDVAVFDVGVDVFRDIQAT